MMKQAALFVNNGMKLGCGKRLAIPMINVSLQGCYYVLPASTSRESLKACDSL